MRKKGAYAIAIIEHSMQKIPFVIALIIYRTWGPIGLQAA